MAELFNNLYSVGPNSIGSGTYVVTSLLNPQKNRGVITRMYKDTNGISVNALASLANLSDLTFPGTTIVLNYTQIRRISCDLALIVSSYGSSSSADGFRRVMSRVPSGYRQIPFWDVTEAYTSKKGNYIGDVSLGNLRPKYLRTIPTMTIRWSSVVYSDSRPSDNQNLVGKVNSNTYLIDGYSHAAETLFFGGTQITHDKYGGYDRWTRAHVVTYDPFTKHRDAPNVVRGAVREDDTWNFTLDPGVDGIQNNPTTNFPNLP